MEKGAIVLSLDFEMMWGNLDQWTAEGYGASNVAQVRLVIEKLLDMLEKYDVKATFATVGLLMLPDKKAMLAHFPKDIPNYQNVKSPFNKDFVNSIDDENEKLYFAYDVINKLKHSSHVEIGTHTFGHFYCWEDGQTLSQFESDIEMAIEVAKKNNIKLNSIVFPRNQVSDEYLNVCSAHGINVYRGNARKYFEKSSSFLKRIRQRVLRLVDSYVNIGGFSSYAQPEIKKLKDGLIINVPASRILRPYSPKLAFAETLRLSRIKNEIIHAAKNHEIYHLWWHPHNFGANMEKNFMFFENVLQCYDECREKYGMLTMNMGDFLRFAKE